MDHNRSTDGETGHTRSTTDHNGAVRITAELYGVPQSRLEHLEFEISNRFILAPFHHFIVFLGIVAYSFTIVYCQTI